MATLRVGHYPINSNTADHAFAIMDCNGEEYRFQCYGGVWDSDRYYPAEYYVRRSMWYTRGGAITEYRELACHPQIAIHLAQWGNPLNWGKHDYDQKSGGYTGRGDCAGLTYALDGVCHQMCNTVTCATQPHDPLNALINWPPSLNSSKLIYGNRGTWGHETAIEDYVRTLLAFYGDMTAATDAAGADAADLDFAPLDAELSAIEERRRAAMRSALENGPDADERRQFLSGAVPGLDAAEPVLDVDLETMALKHELDNLLVRGQISHDEYAARMNEGVRKLVDRYADVMGEESFVQAFGCAAADVDCAIIDTSLMLPDYGIVKESLGL